MERTAGTSKLMAIVLRKVEVRAGNLKLAPEKGSCWLRSRGCSSESPPERENARDWRLKVENEGSGEIYL